MGTEAAIYIALVSSAVNYDQQRRAAKQQKETQEISKATQQKQAIQARRQEARKARVRTAQILQASENVGASNSSGERGGVAAVSSRLAGADGFLRGSEVAATAISNSNQRAADFSFRAGVASNIASISSSFIKPSGGQVTKTQDVFGGGSVGTTDIPQRDFSNVT